MRARAFLRADESASFARLLQEQERAYYMMNPALSRWAPRRRTTPRSRPRGRGGGRIAGVGTLTVARGRGATSRIEIACSRWLGSILRMGMIQAEGLDTDAMTYAGTVRRGEQVGKVVCGLTTADGVVAGSED